LADGIASDYWKRKKIKINKATINEQLDKTTELITRSITKFKGKLIDDHENDDRSEGMVIEKKKSMMMNDKSDD
jgi:hypothetical protein